MRNDVRSNVLGCIFQKGAQFGLRASLLGVIGVMKISQNESAILCYLGKEIVTKSYHEHNTYSIF